MPLSLSAFLQRRCRTLQSLDGTSSRVKSTLESQPPLSRTKLSAATTFQSSPSGNNQCPNCEGNHAVMHCESYQSLNLDEKYQLAKQKGLCYNCLKRGHGANSCPSIFSRRRCERRHHTSLHTLKRPGGEAPSHLPAKQVFSQGVDSETRPTGPTLD